MCRERACDRYDGALASALSVNSAQLFEVQSEALLTQEKVETPIAAPAPDARQGARIASSSARRLR
jgi:hypothetical protein